MKKVFLHTLETQRYFLELSYDGTPFHGWQYQPNAVTVQEHLDKALSIFFKQKIESLGCGRTDAGVHATQFYAHVDVIGVNADRVEKSISSLNALLPYQIAVHRIFKVKADAHARFDAKQRSYEYHIHYAKDPFSINRSWLVKDKLDVEKMNEAGKILLEYTDFSCFSKSNTQTFTNNCRVTRAEFLQKEKGLVFYISADRFLRNMVRAIVGTLVQVGRGEMAPEAMHDVIQSKSRSKAGQSVPACGLYLTQIIYPYIHE